jgi:hypothetical protein
MNPLVASSGYTDPRAACREGYACGVDETHLLQRAGLDSELADWARDARCFGYSVWRNSTADGKVR